MRPPCLLMMLCALTMTALAEENPAATWRSALYPEDWKPGFADDKGRFLHDFSYAGYRRGEAPLPDRVEAVSDVTKPPYLADSTGVKDATAAIQSALDAAAAAGGGVVLMPAGIYRIQPQEGAKVALRISGSNVVLRGEGVGKTFLFNDSTAMREKTMILVEPQAAMDWRDEGQGILFSPLTRDLPNQAVEVFVENVSGFAPGDLVVLRSDLTQRFIDSVEMTGKWQPAGAASPNRTLMFCRRVVEVNPAAQSLILDVPVRYPLKMGDLARVVKIPGRLIAECGLEDFSLGMKQHPGAGLEEGDFSKVGTAGYEVHASCAILIRNAENCWVKNLATYAPEGNSAQVHILSNTLRLARSRFVTVKDCDFKFTQFKGGGGNGYHYTMQGQENLIIDCKGEGARHNFDFGTMACSGNVISRCLAKNGKLGSDFHMFLSMSNLLDQMTCDGDFLEARYFRPWGGNPIHGVTTTQSVFWNTRGLRYSEEKPVLVWSHQLGDGYVIGTSGPCDKVDSDDFVEGIGRGDGLRPQSLYADQLERRRKFEGK
jgi:hypothetical protein